MECRVLEMAKKRAKKSVKRRKINFFAFFLKKNGEKLVRFKKYLYLCIAFEKEHLQ
jgi:hypothetical protein